MATCLPCNIVLRYNFQSFLIVDMSPELVSIIESWTNREVANDHLLCNECFSLVLNELNQEHPSSEQRLGHHFVCVCCGVSLAPRSGRRARSLPEDRPERGRIAALIRPRQIPSNAQACNACWLRAHWNVGNIELPTVAVAEAMSDEDLDETDDFTVSQNENENEVISNVFLTLFRRTPNTSNHCFVHGCTNIERLRVPKYLKKRILIDIKLYVTKSARVCEEHSTFYNWSELNIMLYSNEFNTTQLEEMLILLSDTSMDRFDFEKVEQMDNNICMYWTGLTIQNFMSIYNVIESNINNIKKKKMALGLFLAKLRTGESNIRLSSIFNVSLSGVKKYITQIRNSLKINYVPMHLGTTHLSREALSSRNLTIPQGLFGTEENNPIVICDGTYVYVEKSSNYLFQKKSYSLHKYRNLVKPFLIVSTDGHILDVFGPYPATTSDANIMINLFEDPESELRNYFQRNDVFILDRGFRDSLGLLSSLGYTVYKPETRGINEGPQLSTIRANKSRLVKMCRWVVEVVNGRFKRDFKIFRSNYFNKMSKHLIDDFRIAASIINNFHPVITDRSDANSILERALQRMDIPNHLANHVEVNHLNRFRANFVSIDGDLPQLDMFPVMTMDDLVLFALGTYQIKQARSYYGEHIRTNGTFVVEVSNELTTTNIPGVSTSSHETLLIRGRIRSRHQTNKMYYTYISLNCVEGIWQERISAYYCSCIIGKRTVGTCAHVMTMVWYFGWARHQNNIPPPAAFLDRILLGS